MIVEIIKVGDVVYLESINDRAMRIKELKLIEVVVTKVGRKFFYVNSYFRHKFSLEHMMDKSEYSSEYMVYRSKQAWEDSKEVERLKRSIPGLFTKASLDQLMDIDNRRPL